MSLKRKRVIVDEPDDIGQAVNEATEPYIEYIDDSEEERKKAAPKAIPVTILTLTGKKHEMFIDPSNLLKCTPEVGYVPCVILSGDSAHHRRIQSELRDNSIAGRLANLLVNAKAWTIEFVWAIIHEYLRFLELKMEENPRDQQNVIRLSPPPLIEEVWHLHILDTQHYAADCHQMYATHFPRKVSQMVHHSPLGILDDEKVLQERREAAKKAYQLRFGTTPDEAYWGTEARPEINYRECHCLNCAAALQIGSEPYQMRMIFRGRGITAGMKFSDLQVPLEDMVFRVVLKLKGC
jgi:hypothetical protein